MRLISAELAVALNPFVNFYARQAHAQRPAFMCTDADRWLLFQFVTI
jgi:hypothetical protein